MSWKGVTYTVSNDALKAYNDILILYILLQGDSYGYEISRRIREITDEKYIIKETTLYSAFNRLEKSGYRGCSRLIKN